MSLIFLCWLIFAAVGDFFYRKFSNWLAISGGLIAIISILIYPDSHPVKIILFDSFIGSFFCFFVLLPFYVMKIMGAGDVKFAAVLGLWVGLKVLLPIWALSCGFAVLHGLVVRSNLKYFFPATMNWEDGRQEKGKRFIPYVTYLSISTVIVLMLNK